MRSMTRDVARQSPAVSYDRSKVIAWLGSRWRRRHACIEENAVIAKTGEERMKRPPPNMGTFNVLSSLNNAFQSS